MNALSTRVQVIANRVLSQALITRHLQRRVSQTQIPWICEQCNQRSSLSTRTHRARTQFFRPTARPLQAQNFCIRALSTSSDLQDASKPRDDLPSQEEGRRSKASKRFDHLMDNLQSNIFIAGQRLNDLTGYSGIEALKKDIELQGSSNPNYPLVTSTF